jgi:hypothetical protein
VIRGVKITVACFVLLAVTLVILVSISTERTFVESCKVSVRDMGGRPAQDVRVSESWDAYSYDLSGGDDIQTDDRGSVYFPRRYARHSLFFWIFRPVLTQIYYGVHASFGTSAVVTITQFGVESDHGFTCSETKCSEHPLELQFEITRN